MSMGSASGVPPLAQWPEDEPVPLSHPELPPSILDAVKSIYESFDSLYRIITDNGVEWWLFNGDSELIETFWLEG